MRKLLVILLIATIACNGLVETIESFNEDMIFDYFELDKEAVELSIFLVKSENSSKIFGAKLKVL